MTRRLEDHPSSQKAPFSLGALIGFRLVIVTVLLFVAGYLEAVQEGTLRAPIFRLISATFALNVLYAILLGLAPYRVQAMVQILGDLVVVTGFVYLTGVDRTGFSILYPDQRPVRQCSPWPRLLLRLGGQRPVRLDPRFWSDSEPSRRRR